LDDRGCSVRAVLDHVVGIFEQTDIKQLLLQSGTVLSATPRLAKILQPVLNRFKEGFVNSYGTVLQGGDTRV
jgi:hypothetical protein